ncbi:acyltransferase family protein [Eilatimonas milleporae]|uniref:Peptidoglycan/LPS O-acetylase OafA/YrhL n=1 Tax=Eilatimonas milleporae TaxID=911205 RepID=A0A3M0CIQ5_9PROT|nr:acyltransferase [Eilatimonas milleporae]RMB08745.1 peptidoglycan/LPS O-acetylase OafA/YrhL [Eilatimonas milleporae]
MSTRQSKSANTHSRLSELDWLRVAAVVAVFVHHAGMPFNGDDWGIMNAQSSKLLDDIMVYFEQFRLPILFFVSGAGAGLLLAKRTAPAFAWDKIRRLFLPLLVGMTLIVPPQLYLEDPARYASLWSAYPALALAFEAKHLWFIEYLLVFSLIAIPVQRLLAGDRAQALHTMAQACARSGWGLLLAGLLIAALRVGLKDSFPSDSKSIENLSSSLFYFSFFCAGLILIAHRGTWTRIQSRWRLHACGFLAVSVVFYAYYFIDFSPYFDLGTLWAIWWALGAALAWSGVVASLSMAQRFLWTTPPWLTQANSLIYPFYILHQTVIVIFAYHIVQWPMGIAAKWACLLILSFSVTALACRVLIYPSDTLRFLFGMRSKVKDDVTAGGKAVEQAP